MKWLLLTAALLLSGCTTTLRTPVQPEATLITSYTLNEAEEATTGSEMVRVARAYQLPTFRPVRSYNMAAADMDITLTPDQVWVATEMSDGGYIIRSNAARFSVHVLSDGELQKGFNSPNRRTWWRPAKSDAPFFERTEGVPVEGSFEAELVYSGRSGSTIRLAYREYLDGMARPAFTQELEYDLSESTTIAFKSLKIDILEATNSLIRFRVTEDDGLPWLPG